MIHFLGYFPAKKIMDLLNIFKDLKANQLLNFNPTIPNFIHSILHVYNHTVIKLIKALPKAFKVKSRVSVAVIQRTKAYWVGISGAHSLNY